MSEGFDTDRHCINYDGCDYVSPPCITQCSAVVDRESRVDVTSVSPEAMKKMETEETPVPERVRELFRQRNQEIANMNGFIPIGHAGRQAWLDYLRTLSHRELEKMRVMYHQMVQDFKGKPDDTSQSVLGWSRQAIADIDKEQYTFGSKREVPLPSKESAVVDPALEIRTRALEMAVQYTETCSVALDSVEAVLDTAKKFAHFLNTGETGE